MKIIHINTWDTGGAANAAKRLMRAQRERGMNVSFLSLQRQTSGQDDLNNYEDFLGAKYGKLLTKGLIFSNRIYNQLPVKFDKSVFFNRPETLYKVHQHPLVKDADIIHLHATVKFIDIPTFFQNVQQPIIWTLHDMNPFKGGMHYDSMMNSKLSKLEDKFVQIKKKGLKKANIHVVSPSKWLKDLSAQSELLAHFPHYNIPNCIDSSKFYHVPKETSTKEKKILFVAQNVDDPRKGFQYFLDATKYLDKNIRIMVLGNIDNKEVFSSDANVTYLGYVRSSHELAKVYSDADIHVISSIEDNLPNTIIESHLCGTPVVGFNTSGVSNMITDGFDGNTAYPMTGKVLGEAIKKTFEMIDNGQIVAQEIIKKSRAYYAKEKVVREYKAVYENALKVAP